MKKTTISETAAVLFIILFLYTGICKLIDYRIFREQIASSPVLAPISEPVAMLLPYLEFLVLLLLIIPRWRLRGLEAAFYLMVIFTVYVLAILLFSTQLPCSCGGIIELLSWKQHLVVNSLLIGAAALGARAEKGALRETREKWRSLLEEATYGLNPS